MNRTLTSSYVKKFPFPNMIKHCILSEKLDQVNRPVNDVESVPFCIIIVDISRYCKVLRLIKQLRSRHHIAPQLPDQFDLQLLEKKFTKEETRFFFGRSYLLTEARI